MAKEFKIRIKTLTEMVDQQSSEQVKTAISVINELASMISSGIKKEKVDGRFIKVGEYLLEGKKPETDGDAELIILFPDKYTMIIVDYSVAYDQTGTPNQDPTLDTSDTKMYVNVSNAEFHDELDIYAIMVSKDLEAKLTTIINFLD